MKLVLTTSYECERIEGLKNRKQSERECEGKGKTSEFSLSMRELGLDSDKSQEATQLVSTTFDIDAEGENITSCIEELASAPLDDSNLKEGFEIFGSVFSMLQVEASVLPDDAGQQLSLSVSRQLSGEVISIQNRGLVERELRGGDNAVVIDFATKRKRNFDLSDSIEKGFDRSSVVTETHNIDPLNRSALQTELRLKEQMSARGGMIVDSHSRDGHSQVEDEIQISLPVTAADHENFPVNSSLQPTNGSQSRVDQIVRLVVEQSAALSGTNLFTSERYSHAELNGKTLRLSLHPAELGGVEVSISKRGTRLQVKICPDLESTGHLLLKDSEQLIKRLGLASVATDDVQIQIAINGRAFDVHAVDDQAQFSVRSDRGRDSQNGQNSSAQTSAADQQERHNSGEKPNNTRTDSAGRHVGGGIYI